MKGWSGIDEWKILGSTSCNIIIGSETAASSPSVTQRVTVVLEHEYRHEWQITVVCASAKDWDEKRCPSSPPHDIRCRYTYTERRLPSCLLNRVTERPAKPVLVLHFLFSPSSSFLVKVIHHFNETTAHTHIHILNWLVQRLFAPFFALLLFPCSLSLSQNDKFLRFPPHLLSMEEKVF